MFWTTWIICSGVLGALAVACGAFGAHALQSRLDPEMIDIFEVGARYQMYHAIALLGLGLLAIKIDNIWVHIAGACWVLGTIVFSGSIYTLTLTDNRQWGAVAPFGGTLLILGWIFLTVSIVQR